MSTVVFANQKGGVGKSTLSILYANHLSNIGKKVIVLDTDFQRTLVNQRDSDRSAWNENDFLYNIEYIELRDQEAAISMMKNANEMECTVIVDIPGNITDDYIAPLLAFAQIIICPFIYENKCLESTSTFIQVLTQLTDTIFKRDNKQKRIFIPNLIDSRIGKLEELKQWKLVDNTFMNFGVVSPRIASRAELRRVNTFINTPKQNEYLKNCFDFIDKQIFSD